MNGIGSELHRFGIDPGSAPDQRQWENVCRLLVALLNNPHLQVGNANSQIIFPEPPPPASPGSAARGHDMPYTVKLVTTAGETPSYEATVGWGYVIERIPGSGNAVAYHEAANMWDEVDATKLRKFAIAVGQAVYIKVHVNEDGEISQPPEEPPVEEGEEPTQEDAVAIVVAADNAASVHYQPKVDTDTSAGERGYYFYKLAVLKPAVSPSTQPKLEKWMTGSHLNHWQDLPAIRTALAAGTGIGVIPQEWDDTAKAYKLRAVRQKTAVAAVPPEGEDPGSPAQEVQIHVIQEADAIRIQGNSKIWDVKYRIGHSESTTDVAKFDDGLETLGDEDGDEIIIPIPTVKQRDADPQVTVTPVPGVGSVYEITGNNKDGTLTYTIEGSSPETVLEWKDGLIITEGIENDIPIPTGGGSVHQWKATAATATTIDCLGGTFTSQPDFTPMAVAAVTALSATESGHVILTVLRSSSTRAVTATPIISYAAGTLPESDYSSQIIPLAKVTVEGTGETAQITEILPLKFEEIHVFEDMAAVNGEFRLVDLEMSSRNIYEPPP